jgi:hypothetical protein
MTVVTKKKVFRYFLLLQALVLTILAIERGGAEARQDSNA